MKAMKAMKAKRVSKIARKEKTYTWHEGEDLHGLEEDGPDQEQVRAHRLQEGLRSRQEALRQHQGLDHGGAEGAEGPRREGIPSGKEGLAALQEGQGTLWPVNAGQRCVGPPAARWPRSLRCVGRSTPVGRPELCAASLYSA